MFGCFEPSDGVTKVADSIGFYFLISLNLNEVHNVLLIFLENIFSCKFIDKYSRNQRLEFNYKLVAIAKNYIAIIHLDLTHFCALTTEKLY